MKLWLAMTAVLLQVSVVLAGTNQVSAAIYVKNNLGAEYTQETEALKSMLVARMTSEGFNIIDKEDVVRSVNDYEKNSKLSHADKKLLNQYVDFQSNISGHEVQKHAIFKDIKRNDKDTYDLLDDTSILRLSQMMNCDYFIGATLTSFNKNKRNFKGYGVEQQITEYVLRVSLKIADAVNDGGSVCGDTVVVKRKFGESENLQVEYGDVLNELIDDASVKITQNISSRVAKLTKPVAESDSAEFSVVSDVQGAVVELDGAVIGSTPGKFKVRPGLHKIRVSKLRYLTWVRTINIYPGQTLNVAMEKSDIGLDADSKEQDIALDKTERLSDVENKEKLTDTAVYVGKKDADSREKIAEGVKERESNSYNKIEGAPPKTMYIDGNNGSDVINNINVIDK